MKSEFPSVERDQAERLAEIGFYLRRFREENAIALEQVAAKTLIRTSLLHAIEEGKLNHLPEPVYIQGFIKRYADALGLDGTEIANAFPTGPSLRVIRPSWKNLPAAQLRPVHLYILYIGLIIAAVSGLSYVVSRSAPQTAADMGIEEQAVVSPPSSATTQPGQPTSASSASPPVASTSVLTNAGKPVRIEVTLTAQSWVRVMVDGKTDFEGVLQEGTRRTWMADEELVLRAGNAGGVMVAFNNQQATQMGAPGAVEEVTFPPAQSSASLPSSVAGILPR